MVALAPPLSAISNLPIEVELLILDELDWTQYHTCLQVCKLWRQYLKHKQRHACYHTWAKKISSDLQFDKNAISCRVGPKLLPFLEAYRFNLQHEFRMHHLLYQGGLGFCIQTTATSEEAYFGASRSIYLPASRSRNISNHFLDNTELNLYINGSKFDSPFRRLADLSYLNDIVFPQPVACISVDCFRYHHVENYSLDHFVGRLRFTINKNIPQIVPMTFKVRDLLNIIRKSALEEVKGIWKDPINLFLVLKKPILVEGGRVFISVGVAPGPEWRPVSVLRK